MWVMDGESHWDLAHKGIKLANSEACQIEMQELGLLIGGDYYREIESGKLKCLSGSLVVLNRKFG